MNSVIYFPKVAYYRYTTPRVEESGARLRVPILRNEGVYGCKQPIQPAEEENTKCTRSVYLVFRRANGTYRCKQPIQPEFQLIPLSQLSYQVYIICGRYCTLAAPSCARSHTSKASTCHSPSHPFSATYHSLVRATRAILALWRFAEGSYALVEVLLGNSLHSLDLTSTK